MEPTLMSKSNETGPQHLKYMSPSMFVRLLKEIFSPTLGSVVQAQS